MSNLSSSPGWYMPDGSPVNLVQSSEGVIRECTLREARTMGLLPSVGRILRTIHDEGHTISRIQEAILCAREDTRYPPGDVLNHLASRASAAQVFGGGWHDMAHGVVRAYAPLGASAKLPPLESKLLAPWREGFLGWLTTNCGDKPRACQTVASPRLGYAATVDLVMWHNKLGPCLVDYATTASKPPYLSWSRRWRSCARLAAIAQVFPDLDLKLKCLTLVAHSTYPTRIEERRWTPDELARALTIFQGAYVTWSALTGMCSAIPDETAVP